VQWAIKIQSLAQAGLAYSQSQFDTERYQALRQIAAEMMAAKSGLTLSKINDLFCNEEGYQTPKIGTRAAIFMDDKILLVEENDGTWSLPGGWGEVDLSLAENCVKEVKEEAGLDVEVEKLIALQDQGKHAQLPYPYGVSTAFFLCRAKGGQFMANDETIASDYFAEDELPKLGAHRNTPEQIHMCFAAARAPYWQAKVD
jgi:ADP-ribose pyrophosphatase YjhB (NUDIX family)